MLTRQNLPIVLATSVWCLLVYLVLAPVVREAIANRYGVPSQPTDFAPVVAELMVRRLRPNKCGFVELPPRSTSLTTTGRAFVEQKKNGQVLIFFPTRGQGRGGFRGYLFHSQPLSKLDIGFRYQDYWEVGIALCQKSHLRLEPKRKLGRHWYYVRTSGELAGD